MIVLYAAFCHNEERDEIFIKRRKAGRDGFHRGGFIVK